MHVNVGIGVGVVVGACVGIGVSVGVGVGACVGACVGANACLSDERRCRVVWSPAQQLPVMQRPSSLVASLLLCLVPPEVPAGQT